jgi:hypothetical protein
MKNNPLNYEERKDESILNTYNFCGIEELDPSLSEGHRLIYDREVPFELRLEDSNGPQEVGSLEGIRVKLLIIGEESNPNQIRIEISSESDLFFHYTHEYD